MDRGRHGPRAGPQARARGEVDPGEHVAQSNSVGLAECLEHLGIGFRYNVLASQPEWCLPDPDPGAWEKSSDLLMSWVRDRIARTCFRPGKFGIEPWSASDPKWKVMTNALLYTRQVNPLAEWFETLPEWDGEERIDSLFQRLWRLAETNANAALARWAARYVFLGLVQRTMEPGCKLDAIPLLYGGSTWANPSWGRRCYRRTFATCSGIRSRSPPRARTGSKRPRQGRH